MNDASLLFRAAPTQHSINGPLFAELMPFGYDSDFLEDILEALQAGNLQRFFDGIDMMLPIEITCYSIRISNNHMQFVLTDSSRRRYPGQVVEMSRRTQDALGDIKNALLDLMCNGCLRDLGDGLYEIDRNFQMSDIAT